MQNLMLFQIQQDDKLQSEIEWIDQLLQKQ